MDTWNGSKSVRIREVPMYITWPYHHITWPYHHITWPYYHITWPYYHITWIHHHITWPYPIIPCCILKQSIVRVQHLMWQQEEPLPEQNSGKQSPTSFCLPLSLPAQSTIVKSSLPSKLNIQSCLEQIPVFHWHDYTIRVFKNVISSQRDINLTRKIFLRSKIQRDHIWSELGYYVTHTGFLARRFFWKESYFLL